MFVKKAHRRAGSSFTQTLNGFSEIKSANSLRNSVAPISFGTARRFKEDPNETKVDFLYPRLPELAKYKKVNKIFIISPRGQALVTVEEPISSQRMQMTSLLLLSILQDLLSLTAQQPPKRRKKCATLGSLGKNGSKGLKLEMGDLACQGKSSPALEAIAH